MVNSAQQVIEETRHFFQKVYLWMCLGLVISGATAYWVAMTDSIRQVVLNMPVFLTICALEFILIITLVWFMKKISAQLAVFVFGLYCFFTGLTLSVIFLVFKMESIAYVFFITAGMFVLMSIYGFFTKSDLTKLGQVFLMGLIGIILASVVNMFMHSSRLDLIVSIIGVIIFTGLTAYDTQKIRKQNIIGNEGTAEDLKESILGALDLYLDFVNMFLYLLRLFGQKK